MPASFAARMTRTAISPRLAMRTFSMPAIGSQPSEEPEPEVGSRAQKDRQDGEGTLQGEAKPAAFPPSASDRRKDEPYGPGGSRHPVPKRGAGDAEAADQLPQQRERQPHHRVRIAVDGLDER